MQEREARERLEREVLQQRDLLSELCREVLRLQLHCSGQGEGRQPEAREVREARQPEAREVREGEVREGTRIV